VHLIALLLACSGEPDDDVSDDEPAAELGTGEVSFESLDDDDNIIIVFGPQGGYHFNGSVRAAGINGGDAENLEDPDNPLTTFRVFVDDEQIDVGIDYRQGLDPTADGFEMVGRRVILDIASDDALDGVEVVMEVEIEDVDGTVVTDSRTLIGKPHPLN